MQNGNRARNREENQSRQHQMTKVVRTNTVVDIFSQSMMPKACGQRIYIYMQNNELGSGKIRTCHMLLKAAQPSQGIYQAVHFMSKVGKRKRF